MIGMRVWMRGSGIMRMRMRSSFFRPLVIPCASLYAKAGRSNVNLPVRRWIETPFFSLVSGKPSLPAPVSTARSGNVFRIEPRIRKTQSHFGNLLEWFPGVIRTKSAPRGAYTQFFLFIAFCRGLLFSRANKFICSILSGGSFPETGEEGLRGSLAPSPPPSPVTWTFRDRNWHYSKSRFKKFSLSCREMKPRLESAVLDTCLEFAVAGLNFFFSFLFRRSSRRTPSGKNTSWILYVPGM